MIPYAKLRRAVIGAPLDPLSQTTRQHIALAAFLAWVGLGADGLSSSAYGPEEAFRALGAHTHLGLFMALATAATVFVIALAYNQVIELFPSGGKFSALTPAQQIQVLKAIEKTPFFTQVRVHTITGLLANPEYGGNQGKVGWNLIGFEGKFNYAPPFGYYDGESNKLTAKRG